MAKFIALTTHQVANGDIMMVPFSGKPIGDADSPTNQFETVIAAVLLAAVPMLICRG